MLSAARMACAAEARLSRRAGRAISQNLLLTNWTHSSETVWHSGKLQPVLSLLSSQGGLSSRALFRTVLGACHILFEGMHVGRVAGQDGLVFETLA